MYKGWLANDQGVLTPGQIFLAGLGAGATEAVVVVNPMEVVKIRLQAQQREFSLPRLGRHRRLERRDWSSHPPGPSPDIAPTP